ncbi:uncharacterized protein LOC103518741 isoform X2 [Diaphorina citri]|uniref:Uncharacterized protein LOC103518741 isoform X2 n=1 Tax=Diaphorina citri TaxID=121845 RepID=A0A3Q0JCN1_DIACI|nr:uncharacterized protein LOC103518741 isoform X2 [Diaphorina citri]
MSWSDLHHNWLLNYPSHEPRPRHQYNNPSSYHPYRPTSHDARPHYSFGQRYQSNEINYQTYHRDHYQSERRHSLPSRDTGNPAFRPGNTRNTDWNARFTKRASQRVPETVKKSANQPVSSTKSGVTKTPVKKSQDKLTKKDSECKSTISKTAGSTPKDSQKPELKPGITKNSLNKTLQTKNTSNKPVETKNSPNKTVQTKNTSNKAVETKNASNNPVATKNKAIQAITSNKSVEIKNSANKTVETKNAPNNKVITKNSASNAVETKNVPNNLVATKNSPNKPVQTTTSNKPVEAKNSANKAVETKNASNNPVATKNSPNKAVETKNSPTKPVKTKDSSNKSVEIKNSSNNSGDHKNLPTDSKISPKNSDDKNSANIPGDSKSSTDKPGDDKNSANIPGDTKISTDKQGYDRTAAVKAEDDKNAASKRDDNSANKPGDEKNSANKPGDTKNSVNKQGNDENSVNKQEVGHSGNTPENTKIFTNKQGNDNSVNNKLGDTVKCAPEKSKQSKTGESTSTKIFPFSLSSFLSSCPLGSESEPKVPKSSDVQKQINTDSSLSGSVKDSTKQVKHIEEKNVVEKSETTNNKNVLFSINKSTNIRKTLIRSPDLELVFEKIDSDVGKSQNTVKSQNSEIDAIQIVGEVKKSRVEESKSQNSETNNVIVVNEIEKSQDLQPQNTKIEVQKTPPDFEVVFEHIQTKNDTKELSNSAEKCADKDKNTTATTRTSQSPQKETGSKTITESDNNIETSKVLTIRVRSIGELLKTNVKENETSEQKSSSVVENVPKISLSANPTNVTVAKVKPINIVNPNPSSSTSVPKDKAINVKNNSSNVNSTSGHKIPTLGNVFPSNHTNSSQVAHLPNIQSQHGNPQTAPPPNIQNESSGPPMVPPPNTQNQSSGPPMVPPPNIQNQQSGLALPQPNMLIPPPNIQNQPYGPNQMNMPPGNFHHGWNAPPQYNGPSLHYLQPHFQNHGPPEHLQRNYVSFSNLFDHMPPHVQQPYEWQQQQHHHASQYYNQNCNDYPYEQSYQNVHDHHVNNPTEFHTSNNHIYSEFETRNTSATRDNSTNPLPITNITSYQNNPPNQELAENVCPPTTHPSGSIQNNATNPEPQPTSLPIQSELNRDNNGNQNIDNCSQPETLNTSKSVVDNSNKESQPSALVDTESSHVESQLQNNTDINLYNSSSVHKTSGNSSTQNSNSNPHDVLIDNIDKTIDLLKNKTTFELYKKIMKTMYTLQLQLKKSVLGNDTSGAFENFLQKMYRQITVEFSKLELMDKDKQDNENLALIRLNNSVQSLSDEVKTIENNNSKMSTNAKDDDILFPLASEVEMDKIESKNTKQDSTQCKTLAAQDEKNTKSLDDQILDFLTAGLQKFQQRNTAIYDRMHRIEFSLKDPCSSSVNSPFSPISSDNSRRDSKSPPFRRQSNRNASGEKYSRITRKKSLSPRRNSFSKTSRPSNYSREDVGSSRQPLGYRERSHSVSPTRFRERRTDSRYKRISREKSMSVSPPRSRDNEYRSRLGPRLRRSRHSREKSPEKSLSISPPPSRDYQDRPSRIKSRSRRSRYSREKLPEDNRTNSSSRRPVQSSPSRSRRTNDEQSRYVVKRLSRSPLKYQKRNDIPRHFSNSRQRLLQSPSKRDRELPHSPDERRSLRSSSSPSLKLESKSKYSHRRSASSSSSCSGNEKIFRMRQDRSPRRSVSPRSSVIRQRKAEKIPRSCERSPPRSKINKEIQFSSRQRSSSPSGSRSLTIGKESRRSRRRSTSSSSSCSQKEKNRRFCEDYSMLQTENTVKRKRKPIVLSPSPRKRKRSPIVFSPSPERSNAELENPCKVVYSQIYSPELSEEEDGVYWDNSYGYNIRSKPTFDLRSKLKKRQASPDTIYDKQDLYKRAREILIERKIEENGSNMSDLNKEKVRKSEKLEDLEKYFSIRNKLQNLRNETMKSRREDSTIPHNSSIQNKNNPHGSESSDIQINDLQKSVDDIFKYIDMNFPLFDNEDGDNCNNENITDDRQSEQKTQMKHGENSVKQGPDTTLAITEDSTSDIEEGEIVEDDLRDILTFIKKKKGITSISLNESEKDQLLLDAKAYLESRLLQISNEREQNPANSNDEPETIQNIKQIDEIVNVKQNPKFDFLKEKTEDNEHILSKEEVTLNRDDSVAMKNSDSFIEVNVKDPNNDLEKINITFPQNPSTANLDKSKNSPETNVKECKNSDLDTKITSPQNEPILDTDKNENDDDDIHFLEDLLADIDDIFEYVENEGTKSPSEDDESPDRNIKNSSDEREITPLPKNYESPESNITNSSKKPSLKRKLELVEIKQEKKVSNTNSSGSLQETIKNIALQNSLTKSSAGKSESSKHNHYIEKTVDADEKRSLKNKLHDATNNQKLTLNPLSVESVYKDDVLDSLVESELNMMKIYVQCSNTCEDSEKTTNKCKIPEQSDPIEKPLFQDGHLKILKTNNSTRTHIDEVIAKPKHKGNVCDIVNNIDKPLELAEENELEMMKKIISKTDEKLNLSSTSILKSKTFTEDDFVSKGGESHLSNEDNPFSRITSNQESTHEVTHTDRMKSCEKKVETKMTKHVHDNGNDVLDKVSIKNEPLKNVPKTDYLENENFQGNILCKDQTQSSCVSDLNKKQYKFFRTKNNENSSRQQDNDCMVTAELDRNEQHNSCQKEKSKKKKCSDTPKNSIVSSKQTVFKKRTDLSNDRNASVSGVSSDVYELSQDSQQTKSQISHKSKQVLKNNKEHESKEENVPQKTLKLNTKQKNLSKKDQRDLNSESGMEVIPKRTRKSFPVSETELKKLDRKDKIRTSREKNKGDIESEKKDQDIQRTLRSHRPNESSYISRKSRDESSSESSDEETVQSKRTRRSCTLQKQTSSPESELKKCKESKRIRDDNSSSDEKIPSKRTRRSCTLQKQNTSQPECKRNEKSETVRELESPESSNVEISSKRTRRSCTLLKQSTSPECKLTTEEETKTRYPRRSNVQRASLADIDSDFESTSESSDSEDTTSPLDKNTNNVDKKNTRTKRLEKQDVDKKVSVTLDEHMDNGCSKRKYVSVAETNPHEIECPSKSNSDKGLEGNKFNRKIDLKEIKKACSSEDQKKKCDSTKTKRECDSNETKKKSRKCDIKTPLEQGNIWKVHSLNTNIESEAGQATESPKEKIAKTSHLKAENSTTENFLENQKSMKNLPSGKGKSIATEKSKHSEAQHSSSKTNRATRTTNPK